MLKCSRGELCRNVYYPLGYDYPRGELFLGLIVPGVNYYHWVRLPWASFPFPLGELWGLESYMNKHKKYKI